VSDRDASQILGALARQDPIPPLATQGHIKVISGTFRPIRLCSTRKPPREDQGRPLFNDDGNVIGVTYAVCAVSAAPISEFRFAWQCFCSRTDDMAAMESTFRMGITFNSLRGTTYSM
jgi:hypothetical protein